MSVNPKLPPVKSPVDKGQSANYATEKYAVPFEDVDSGVPGLDSLHDDIGEKSGFQSNTDGYIDKKGMVYGEAAKLNIMPPGMDISDQPYVDIREMKLKKVTSESYEGDGWEPAPRDLPESSSSKGKLA